MGLPLISTNWWGYQWRGHVGLGAGAGGTCARRVWFKGMPLFSLCSGSGGTCEARVRSNLPATGKRPHTQARRFTCPSLTPTLRLGHVFRTHLTVPSPFAGPGSPPTLMKR